MQKTQRRIAIEVNTAMRQQENCANCGAVLNPAHTCDYCGTGAVALYKRIKRGVARILQPAELTPDTLRHVSQHNAAELDATCDISRHVTAINAKIKSAAERGQTSARFTLQYVRMSKRERKFVIDYYKGQGFKVLQDWYVSPDEVAERNFWAVDASTKERVYIKVCWR